MNKIRYSVAEAEMLRTLHESIGTSIDGYQNGALYAGRSWWVKNGKRGCSSTDSFKTVRTALALVAKGDLIETDYEIEHDFDHEPAPESGISEYFSESRTFEFSERRQRWIDTMFDAERL
jgi:hypothetical protein